MTLKNKIVNLRNNLGWVYWFTRLIDERLFSILLPKPFQGKTWVIVGTARSGTSLLSQYLHCPPVSASCGEFLNINKYLNPDRTQIKLSLVWLETILFPMAAFAREVRTNKFNSRFIGFKAVHGQNNYFLSQLMQNDAVIKVHVSRRNLVRRFVSQRLAEASGVWSSASNKVAKVRTVSIDTSKLLDNIQKLEKQTADLMEKHGDSVLFITYEDIVQNRTDSLNKLAKHLGVELADFPLAPPLRKLNAADLNELVENYAELEAALKGTKYEQYLVEDYV